MRNKAKLCRRCGMFKSVYAICHRCSRDLVGEALQERMTNFVNDLSVNDLYDIVKTMVDAERITH